MTVKAKVAEVGRLAEHLASTLKQNGLDTDVRVAHVLENAIRNVVANSGTQNNALIVVAEHEYDKDLNYPYFSWLPDDKRIV